MASELVSPWPAFLSDLGLIACSAAFVLYALKRVTAWEPLSDFGRLALLVAFGALCLIFASTGGPSPALLFLFVLLAVFLALEFLFSMSALGWFVALLGVVILLHHRLYPLALAPPVAPVSAYWFAIRDIAMPTGCAFLTVGMAAALLLSPRNPRPGSGLSAPNDLFDVAIVVSKAALPFLFFGTVAAALALGRSPGASRQTLWLAGAAILLLLGAVPWLFGMDKRRLAGGERRWVLVLDALGLLAYAAGAWL